MITRSTRPAYGRTGAIAAGHPDAARAGTDVLARGGSAMDAAIAAQAVICVAMPQAAGLGGDMLALIRTEDRIMAVKGRGSRSLHVRRWGVRHGARSRRRLARGARGLRTAAAGEHPGARGATGGVRLPGRSDALACRRGTGGAPRAPWRRAMVAAGRIRGAELVAARARRDPPRHRREGQGRVLRGRGRRGDRGCRAVSGRRPLARRSASPPHRGRCAGHYDVGRGAPRRPAPVEPGRPPRHGGELPGSLRSAALRSPSAPPGGGDGGSLRVSGPGRRGRAAARSASRGRP